MIIKATARVQITISITLGDRWGDDCPIGKLHMQAGNIARERLLRQLSGKNLEPIDYCIIGEPKVVGVITED